MLRVGTPPSPLDHLRLPRGEVAQVERRERVPKRQLRNATHVARA
jgi:hypothetical protein